MTLVSVYAVWTVRRRTKSAAHAYPIALPVRGDAARAHEQSEAPASCQTKRPSNQGRRSGASPPSRTAASCPARGTTRSRCGTCCEVGSSGRYAGTWTQRGAGVQSNRAIDARRHRDGRRSIASPPCRTATSCPVRATARSRCGTRRPATASRHYAGTRAERGAGVQSTQRVDRSSTPRRAQVNCVAVLPHGRVVSGSRDNTLKVWDPSTGACLQTLCGHGRTARGRRPVEQRVDASPRRDGRRSCASPSCRTATSCPGRSTARSWCGKM